MSRYNQYTYWLNKLARLVVTMKQEHWEYYVLQAA